MSGSILAEELGMSLRTLYRDIATLQAQGVPVEGEAGVGFILRPGFTLPPLMFTVEQIEAIVLGARWVLERGDDRLAIASRNALAKIGDAVPQSLKESLQTGTLLVPTQDRPAVDAKLVEAFRDAVREEVKVAISYVDLQDRRTDRVIWPFALAYYEQVLVIMAWCESRRNFRHFRADRIEEYTVSTGKYSRGRLALLREWQEKTGIPFDKYDL